MHAAIHNRHYFWKSADSHPFIQIISYFCALQCETDCNEPCYSSKYVSYMPWKFLWGEILGLQIFVPSGVTITNQEEELSVQIPLLRYKILLSKTAVQDTY